MSNAKAVRQPKLVPIMLDKERHLKYDLNAFIELEEAYGSIEQALNNLSSGKLKAVRALLWAGLIHEDETLTMKEVGSLMRFENMEEIAKKINEALVDALPEGTEVPNEGNSQTQAPQLPQQPVQ